MVFNMTAFIAALRLSLEREAFCKSPNSKIVLSLPGRREKGVLKQKDKFSFSSDSGYYLRFYSTSAKGVKSSSPRLAKDTQGKNQKKKKQWLFF